VKYNKLCHKIKIQFKCSRWSYLNVVVHHLCGDHLYAKRKTFALSSLGITFRFKSSYISIVRSIFKNSLVIFLIFNLECQCIQFQTNFMFINNDGIHFCIMYHNLNNYNVHARFTPLHYNLQFSCPNLLKSTTMHLHWTP
jgi:hypothetical protein